MKLSSLLNVNEAKDETSWYGFIDGQWYVGFISKVDGKLFSSENTGPFNTKAEAEEELEKNKKNAYLRVFQVKNKTIIRHKRKGWDY